MTPLNPIVSMYGIFSYIYHKNQPNVGIYTIHGSYGNGWLSDLQQIGDEKVGHGGLNHQLIATENTTRVFGPQFR